MSYFTRMGPTIARTLVAKAAAECDDCGLVTKDNIDNLAKHFEKEPHPFSACMDELAKQYPDEARRKQVCGAVKARIGGTG
jgi:hypothetical protein